MWAIRRASIHLKNRGLSSGTTRICSVKSDITSYYSGYYNAGIIESQGKVLDALVSSRKFHNKSIFHTFSSHAGAHDHGGKDDMDDELTSDSELSEFDNGVQNELESFDSLTDVGKNKSVNTKTPSALTKAILAAPKLPANKVLDKCVQEGNKVDMNEISHSMRYLRQQRLFVKALQVSIGHHLKFFERNYASRVDLIAKVRGILNAEKYINQIPQSFRGEFVHRCMLANMVFAREREKSEALYNKMRYLFPLSAPVQDDSQDEIGDILSLMEKENIKPSVFTYQILIDLKGQINDINGIEKILEKMKSNGVEPNMYTRASLVRVYATCGLKRKAEAIFKEMEKEKDDMIKNRRVCRFLLLAYVSLNRDDKVEKFWKVCEHNPRLSECISVIEAWGKLNRIEKAEAVFDKMLTIVNNPSAEHYTVLLNIYTNHNMLSEGKNLIVRMVESGVKDFTIVWDAMVKLYVRAGEVTKAESILEKAHKQTEERQTIGDFLFKDIGPLCK